MTRNRSTPAEKAAGQLISVVQKVQANYSGTDEGYFAEAVMNRAHEIHQAIIGKRLAEALAGRSLREYLDEDWISWYPDVEAAVRALEAALS